MGLLKDGSVHVDVATRVLPGVDVVPLAIPAEVVVLWHTTWPVADRTGVGDDHPPGTQGPAFRCADHHSYDRDLTSALGIST